MLGKKIVYGLITIIALWFPLFLTSAAHYTPPAGFEGLAQEYYQEPSAELIKEAQQAIQGYNTDPDRLGFDFHHILSQFIHKPYYRNLPVAEYHLRTQKNKQKVRALFDALLHATIRIGRKDIDISKAPYIHTLTDILDTRLQTYLNLFGIDSVEGKWFTKLYLDWLLKNNNNDPDAPAIKDFINRYRGRLNSLYYRESFIDESLDFINQLLSKPTPSTHMTPPQPATATVAPSAVPETKEKASSSEIESQRPLAQEEQAATVKLFPDLAPEYLQPPSQELIKKAQTAIRDYNKDKKIGGSYKLHDILWNFIKERDPLSWELTVLKKDDLFNSTNKQNFLAFFYAMLSPGAIIDGNDISKAPYIGENVVYRDQWKDSLDSRLQTYLSILNTESVEGKWFTKLYLDWLLKNNNYNPDAPAIKDFIERYRNWVYDPHKIIIYPEKLRNFIDNLLQPYKQSSQAAIPTSTAATSFPSSVTIPPSTVAALAALQEHKAKAETARQEPTRAHLESQAEIKEESAIEPGAPATPAFVSAATPAAITTAPTPSTEEKEKINEQERMGTEQLVEEFSDIEKQLQKFNIELAHFEQKLQIIKLFSPAESKIPELTQLQRDFASIQPIDRIIARINDIKADPEKLKHSALKIEEFETRIKSIQSKLQIFKQKIAADIATNTSDLQRKQKFDQGSASALPKQPIPPKVTPSPASATPAARARKPLAPSRPVAPKAPTRATPSSRPSASAHKPTARLAAPVQPKAPLKSPALSTPTRIAAPRPTAQTATPRAPTRVTPPTRSSAPVTRAVPSRTPAPTQPPLPSRPSALPTPSRAAPRHITRPTAAQPATPRVPTRVTPPARSLVPVTRTVSSRAAQAQSPLPRPAAAPTQPILRSTSLRVTPPAARPAATRPLATATQTRRPAAAPAVPSSRPTPRATTQPAPRLTPTRSTSAARPAAVLRPSAVPPRSTAVMQRQQAAQEKARLAAQAKADARTQSTRPPVRPGYRR